MSDYRFNDTVNIPYLHVKEWVRDLYKKVGMSNEDAEIAAEVQVNADLRGVYSHGIQHCQTYVRRILDGGINPKGQLEILKDAKGAVIADAHNAIGQYSSFRAMELAIDRARMYGSSSIIVKNGEHIGTMAYYAMMASKEDMIGTCFTQGAANTMAPYGGIIALLGNNPMGYAIPAYSKPDVVMDIAVSGVAHGKIAMAATVGNSIPDTWALDNLGNPTTDPSKVFTLQPMSGHKGYGLSVITTMMTAVLCDSPWGNEQRNLIDPSEKRPLETSCIMQVINVAALTDVKGFKKRVDAAIDTIKNSDKREGVSEILVPGEPEYRLEQRQLKEGITYPVELIKNINKKSDEWGVAHIIEI